MSKLILINIIDALWICYFPKQTCSAIKWNYSESKNKNSFFHIPSIRKICTLERNAIHRSHKILFVLCDIDDGVSFELIFQHYAWAFVIISNIPMFSVKAASLYILSLFYLIFFLSHLLNQEKKTLGWMS